MEEKRKRGRPRNPESMRAAAEAAGLSRHQMKQALRVAHVPDDVFETLVESDNPPPITALARLGTQPAPAREPSLADPLEDWTAFVEYAGRRLQAGRRTYGDRSFYRPPLELVGEVEEELLDVAAWAFILWKRVHALRGKVVR